MLVPRDLVMKQRFHVDHNHLMHKTIIRDNISTKRGNKLATWLAL